jgi:CRP/FNR family transcriptional regulator, cyclic AMP receptor protein
MVSEAIQLLDSLAHVLPRPNHPLETFAMAGSTGSETTHRLGDVPLFARLPEAALEELARASRTRTYPAGQVIWSEGDPGDALLVLEEGQLRVTRTTGGGVEVVLAVNEAPAALGELALLDGEPRSASVIAQRPVRVRFIPRNAFLALLRREPVAVEGLLHTLADMVRAGNERHLAAVGLDVPGRLAVWLLDRAKSRSGSAGQLALALNRSQSELAAELGTTRSTLNRASNSFIDLDLIAKNGDHVVILKPEALAAYTELPPDQ